MGTRKTAIESYLDLLSRGVLDGRRLEVFNWLAEHGPSTASEAALGIGGDRGATSCRLGELVKRRWVREVGERKCRVTGKNVIFYEVIR